MHHLKKLVLFFSLLASTVAIAAGQRVVLEVMPGCEYCAQAEHILDHSGIKYHTTSSKGGPVPKLYVNGNIPYCLLQPYNGLQKQIDDILLTLAYLLT